MPHPFVVFLQAKQRQEGLSDARFARERLGVSPALWCQVATGGRGIGPKLISGAFRAYPSSADRQALSDALGHPIAPVHRPTELPRAFRPAALPLATPTRRLATAV